MTAERIRWVQFLGRGIWEHGIGIGSSKTPSYESLASPEIIRSG
jgi:hypothetical protein